jgi:hypothetical protein
MKNIQKRQKTIEAGEKKKKNISKIAFQRKAKAKKKLNFKEVLSR